MRPGDRTAVLVALSSLVAVAAVGSPAFPDPERASAPAILSSACRPAPDEPACAPDGPRAEALQIWALPEAGMEPLIKAISRAQKSIRLMIYEVGEGPILEALEQKARSGVPVRVILDAARADVNRPYYDRLRDAGAQVRWSSPRFNFTHAKTMILDDTVAMISTGNYDASYLATERNYVVRDADPADVAVLVRLFDADWRSKTPDLRCTRMLIAPVNARERLLHLIESAAKTLDIESTELSDDEVRAAVLGRAASGVAVRVILADPGWVAANRDAAAFLAHHRIPVRFLWRPAVHVKAILVDGQRAYLGSENLSYTSLSKNREIGLIASEVPVLETMASTFASDWARAVPF
jgi:cardiolipin synthase A/B